MTRENTSARFVQGWERGIRLGTESATACISFKQQQGLNLSQWLKSQPAD